MEYQYGQNGHKLISSAADFYDHPLVSTEVYGAYDRTSFDSLMLYRSVMDLFARGVNLVIPHGMWYNPEKVYIPPLVSPYNKEIAFALPAYSEFVGRSSMLLRGGRRVSEIGVIYPFESLAGWFRFDNPENVRQGSYVSPETDYQTISGWLTNEIRRDFTFVHPELMLDEKYTIEEGLLKLNNNENHQAYKTLILSGSNMISHKTLDKLKSFYDAGGLIISTTQLPFKSAEMGEDQKVVDLIKEIFNIDPLTQVQHTQVYTNENEQGGRAVFIPSPDAVNLSNVLEKYDPTPDVIFKESPQLKNDLGKFSYIHKIKGKQHIYYFTNSTDETISTNVMLKGKMKVKIYNPHTGDISKGDEIKHIDKDGQVYTSLPIELDPVKSYFVIAE